MKAKNKFLDPLIPRKGAIVDNIQFYKKNIPLPSIVEISESGTCNRKCSFCPRSAPDFKDVKEFITNELAKKIEIVKYILFLISEENSYTTGQTISISGGE